MTWSEVVERPVREASLFDATRTACWGLAALLLAAFFSAAYLPMVDLPQHAAQVETWRRLADAGSPEARVFTLNLGSSLAVLGLPLALGYPFYFGFVSFTAAMPLVLFALGAALSHREAPTRRSGAVLTLRALEGTVLEAVARSEGWSRRTLHPTKLEGEKLHELLAAAQLQRVTVKQVAFGWALSAWGWK